MTARLYAIVCLTATILGLGFTSKSFPNESKAAEVRIFDPKKLDAGKIDEIENRLKKVPGLKNYMQRIYRIVEWGSGTNQKILIAARSGPGGRTVGCSFYEQDTDGNFVFLIGQPYCKFTNESESYVKEGIRIVQFDISDRQYFGGQLFNGSYSFIFNSEKNTFCHPDSESEIFKCPAELNKFHSEFYNPSNPRLLQRNEIGARRLEEVEGELREFPNFDVDHHRILSIVEWGVGSMRGTVIVASEGVGKSSGCSIYEKVGAGKFEFITGGPFCHFIKNPVGHMTKDSGRVKFDASIRQWYDGPPTPITFELVFDEARNIFCEPTSQSEAFKCRMDTVPSR